VTTDGELAILGMTSQEVTKLRSASAIAPIMDKLNTTHVSSPMLR
jgi:hypothetical protein